MWSVPDKSQHMQGSYLGVKGLLERWVFKPRLNESREGALWSYSGRQFRRAGPALLNALSPHLCCISGTPRRRLLLDRKALRAQRGFMTSVMYEGNRFFIARYTCKRNLNSMRNFSASSWAQEWSGTSVFVWWLSAPLHSDIAGDRSADYYYL